MQLVHKQRFSIALPLILLLVGLMLLKTRGYAETRTGPINAWNLHKVFSITLALLIGSAAIVRYGVPTKIGRVNTALGLYILVGFISLTINDSLGAIAVWKLVELSAVWLVSLHMTRVIRLNFVEPWFFYEVTLSVLKLLVVMTLLGVLINPSEALRPVHGVDTTELIGPTLIPFQLHGTIIKINSNTIGVIAAVLLLVHLVRGKLNRSAKVHIAWIMTLGIVLILSQSRTAVLGFIVAFASIQVISGRTSALKSLLFFGVVIIVGILASGTLWEYLSRGMDTEKVVGMSGRLNWWAVAYSEFQSASIDRRIFGLGFYNASRTILSTSLNADGASTLHSDYVDSLISTGWLGASLLTTAVLSFTARCYAHSVDSGSMISREFLGISLILVLRSFTGPTFFSYNLFMILFLSASAYISPSHKARVSQHFGGSSIPKDPS